MDNYKEVTKAKDWWYDISDAQTQEILIKHKIALPIKDRDIVKLFSIYGVSQRSELLPAFLERKDFDIITLKTAGTSVLKDWEEYLKAVNCG